MWILINGGGCIIIKSNTRTAEQLWDSWSRETGLQDRILGVYLYLDVCVCGSQSGLSQIVVPIPWLPSFALNSVPSAWLGDNTLGFSSRWPLLGARLLILGASQPPTHWCLLVPLISTSPGSQRSRHHLPGAHCAPHHCRQYVTFSAGGGRWERRTKKERAEK